MLTKESIIEAILFASGKEVSEKELMNAVQVGKPELMQLLENLKEKYKQEISGIELIKLENAYQLTTKKEMYEYIVPVFDNRSTPGLSNVAMEVLSIIAYNPKITRSQIESIRGINSDGVVYKLLDFGLIEESRKKQRFTTETQWGL
jgi:segregation and condensation protein B